MRFAKLPFRHGTGKPGEIKCLIRVPDIASQHQLLGSLLSDSNDSGWRNLIDRATVESLKRPWHRFIRLRL